MISIGMIFATSHEAYLNGFGDYDSAADWRFDDGDKPDVPFLPDYVSHQENPTATFHVDLKPYCNMGFADEKPGEGKGGWTDEGPMNDMRELPTGLQEFYGIPFEIVSPATNNGNGVIALKGSKLTPTCPEKVTIPVNRKKVRYLYFLQA